MGIVSSGSLPSGACRKRSAGREIVSPHAGDKCCDGIHADVMRLVRPAIAASTTSGAETAKSARWCSPTPKKSTPSVSARIASSMTSRMTCAWGRSWPSGPAVMSPKVSSPSSRCVAIRSSAPRESSAQSSKGNCAGQEIVFPRGGDRACERVDATAPESGAVRKSIPVWPIGYSAVRALAAYCSFRHHAGGASCGNSCWERLR